MPLFIPPIDAYKDRDPFARYVVTIEGLLIAGWRPRREKGETQCQGLLAASNKNSGLKKRVPTIP